MSNIKRGPWRVDPVVDHDGFEKGNYWISSNNGLVDIAETNGDYRPEVEHANALLIASAGTTSTEVEDMGYDALKAMRALPVLLEAVKQHKNLEFDNVKDNLNEAFEILNKD